MYHSNKSPAPTQTEQLITSLEIAEISGVTHANLLKSIRKQEEAWKKVSGVNFYSAKYKDDQGKLRPMYNLSKSESLYISSKFNDEVRAKLVLRWVELENNKSSNTSNLLEQSLGDYPHDTVITVAMGDSSNQIYIKDGVRLCKMATVFSYLGYYNSPTHYIAKIKKGVTEKIAIGKQKVWFIDIVAFGEMLNYGQNHPFGKVQEIYQGCFGKTVEKDKDNPCTYHFTDSEILEIISNVNKKPINKTKVLELLLNGKN